MNPVLVQSVDLDGSVSVELPIDDSTDFTLTATTTTYEYDDDQLDSSNTVTGLNAGLDRDDFVSETSTSDSIDIVVEGVVGEARADFDPTTQVSPVADAPGEGQDPVAANTFSEDGRSDVDAHGAGASEAPLVLSVNYAAETEDGVDQDTSAEPGEAVDSDNSEGITKIVLDMGDSDGQWVALGLTGQDGYFLENAPEGRDAEGTVSFPGGVTADYSFNAAGDLVLTFDDPGVQSIDLDGVIGVELPIDDSSDFTITATTTTSEYDDDAAPGATPVDTTDTVDTVDIVIEGVAGAADAGFDFEGTEYPQGEGQGDGDGDAPVGNAYVTFSEDGESDSDDHGDGADEDGLSIAVAYGAKTKDGAGQDVASDDAENSEGIARITLDMGASDGAWAIAGLGSIPVVTDSDTDTGDGGRPAVAPASPAAVTIDGHAAHVSIDAQGDLVIEFDNPALVQSVDLNSFVTVELPIDDSSDFTLTATTTTYEYDDDQLDSSNTVTGLNAGLGRDDFVSETSTSDSIDIVVEGVVGEARADFDPTTQVSPVADAPGEGQDPVAANTFSEDGRSDVDAHGAGASEAPLVLSVNYAAETEDGVDQDTSAEPGEAVDSDNSEGITKIVLDMGDSDGQWVALGLTGQDGYFLEDAAEGQDAEGTVSFPGGVTADYSFNAAGDLVLTFDDPGVQSIDLDGVIGVELPIDDSYDFTITATTTTSEYDDDAAADATPVNTTDTVDTVDIVIEGVAGAADAGFDFAGTEYPQGEGQGDGDGDAPVGNAYVTFSEDGESDSDDHGDGADEDGLSIAVAYGAKTKDGAGQDVASDDAENSEGIARITLDMGASDGAWAIAGLGSIPVVTDSDTGTGEGGRPAVAPASPAAVTIDGHAAHVSIDAQGDLVIEFDNPALVQSVDLNSFVTVELPIDDSSDFTLTATTTTYEYDDDQLDSSNTVTGLNAGLDRDDFVSETSTSDSIDIIVEGVVGEANIDRSGFAGEDGYLSHEDGTNVYVFEEDDQSTVDNVDAGPLTIATAFKISTEDGAGQDRNADGSPKTTGVDTDKSEAITKVVLTIDDNGERDGDDVGTTDATFGNADGSAITAPGVTIYANADGSIADGPGTGVTSFFANVTLAADGQTLTIEFADLGDPASPQMLQNLDLGGLFTVVNPQHSDLDVKLSVEVTTSEYDDDGDQPVTTTTNSDEIVLQIDAIADKPQNVSIEVLDSAGDSVGTQEPGGAFWSDEPGQVDVAATFPDNDGSESFTITVDIPVGFDVTNVDATLNNGSETITGVLSGDGRSITFDLDTGDLVGNDVDLTFEIKANDDLPNDPGESDDLSVFTITAETSEGGVTVATLGDASDDSDVVIEDAPNVVGNSPVEIQVNFADETTDAPFPTETYAFPATKVLSNHDITDADSSHMQKAVVTLEDASEYEITMSADYAGSLTVTLIDDNTVEIKGIGTKADYEDALHNIQLGWGGSDEPTDEGPLNISVQVLDAVVDSSGNQVTDGNGDNWSEVTTTTVDIHFKPKALDDDLGSAAHNKAQDINSGLDFAIAALLGNDSDGDAEPTDLSGHTVEILTGTGPTDSNASGTLYRTDNSGLSPVEVAVGTVVVNGDGTFTVTLNPDLDYVGEVHFAYKLIDDAEGTFDLAKVTLDLTNANPELVVDADGGDIVENSSVPVALTGAITWGDADDHDDLAEDKANDHIDPASSEAAEGGLTITVNSLTSTNPDESGSVDGAIATGAGNDGETLVTIEGAYGTLVINEAGTYSYTPFTSVDHTAVDDTGDSLTDSFEITVQDDHGGFKTLPLAFDVLDGQATVAVSTIDGSVQESDLDANFNSGTETGSNAAGTDTTANGTFDVTLAGDALGVVQVQGDAGFVTINTGAAGVPATTIVEGELGTLTVTELDGAYSWSYELKENSTDHSDPDNVGSADTVTDDFNVRVADFDDDVTNSPSVPFSITIGDDGPTADTASISLEVDEAGIPDDDSSTIFFTEGADGITSFAFELSDGLTQPSDANLDESLTWDMTSDTVWTATDGQGNLVLTLTLVPGAGNSSVSVEVDLNDELEHVVGTDLVTFTGVNVVATDADGDETSPVPVTITVDDDGPTVGIGATSAVDTDYVEAGGTVDGTWTYDFGADDGADATVQVTVEGSTLTLPLVAGENNEVEFTTDEGVLTVRQDGTWTFVATNPADENSGNPDVAFEVTVTDADGDSVSHEHNINVLTKPTITFTDDDLNVEGNQAVILEDTPRTVTATVAASGDDLLATVTITGLDDSQITTVTVGGVDYTADIIAGTLTLDVSDLGNVASVDVVISVDPSSQSDVDIGDVTISATAGEPDPAAAGTFLNTISSDTGSITLVVDAVVDGSEVTQASGVEGSDNGPIGLGLSIALGGDSTTSAAALDDGSAGFESQGDADLDGSEKITEVKIVLSHGSLVDGADAAIGVEGPDGTWTIDTSGMDYSAVQTMVSGLQVVPVPGFDGTVDVDVYTTTTDANLTPGDAEPITANNTDNDAYVGTFSVEVNDTTPTTKNTAIGVDESEGNQYSAEKRIDQAAHSVGVTAGQDTVAAAFAADEPVPGVNLADLTFVSEGYRPHGNRVDLKDDGGALSTVKFADYNNTPADNRSTGTPDDLSTSDGQAITLVTSDSDPSVVYGMAGGDIAFVATIALNSAGTGYEIYVKQFLAIENHDTNNANEDSLVDLGIIVVDNDGTESAPANLTIQFRDDGPSVEIDNAGTETESVVSGGTADGTWTYDFGVDDGTGATVEIIVDGASQTLAAGNFVTFDISGKGILTVDSDGTWSFAASATPSTATANPDFSFDVKVTDADGDSETATHNIDITSPPVIVFTGGVNAAGNQAVIKEDSVDNEITATVTAVGDDLLSGLLVTGLDDSQITSIKVDGVEFNHLVAGGELSLDAMYLGFGPSWEVVITINPDAQSDVDLSNLSITATAQEPTALTTSTSAPATVAIVVDAVADAATDLDAVADPGTPVEKTSVDVDLTATFADATDGSEAHEYLVEVQAPFTSAGFTTVDVTAANAADYPGVTHGTYIVVDADSINSVTLNVGNVTEDETYVLDVYAISREEVPAGSGNEDDLSDNIAVVSTTVSVTVNDGVPSVISATGTNLGLTEVGLDAANDVETATVTFDQGTDGIDSVTLGLATGLTAPSVSNLDETLTWSQLVPSGDWQARDAEGNLLLTVQVSDTVVAGDVVATVTATLSDEFKHLVSTDSLEITGFEVVADEGTVDGDTVAQAITITVADDTPDADDDVNSVTEDTVLTTTGNVLNNDDVGEDVVEGGQAEVTWTDGGTTTETGYAQEIAGDHGTLFVNADGTYKYVLDNTDPEVQALSAPPASGTVSYDTTLTETFSYNQNDNDGDQSPADLVITINGNDDIVTITGTADLGDSDAVVDEAQISDSDSDTFVVTAVDGLASITIDGVTVDLSNVAGDNSDDQTITTGQYGTLVITSVILTDADAGQWTVSYRYELDENTTDHSVQGTDSVFDSFALTATDVDGSPATGTLNVEVIDDVPTTTITGAGPFVEGAASQPSGSWTHDFGADDASPAKVEIIVDGEVQVIDVTGTTDEVEFVLDGRGTLTVKADHTWTFDPDTSGDHGFDAVSAKTIAEVEQNLVGQPQTIDRADFFENAAGNGVVTITGLVGSVYTDAPEYNDAFEFSLLEGEVLRVDGAAHSSLELMVFDADNNPIPGASIVGGVLEFTVPESGDYQVRYTGDEDPSTGNVTFSTEVTIVPAADLTFTVQVTDEDGDVATATETFDIVGKPTIVITNGGDVDVTGGQAVFKEDSVDQTVTATVNTDGDDVLTEITLGGFGPTQAYTVTIGGVESAPLTGPVILTAPDFPAGSSSVEITITTTPDPQSDVDLGDLTVTAKATDPNAGGSSQSSAEVTVIVDAVADAATGLNAVADPGTPVEKTSVDVDLTATFADATDGSEAHEYLVEVSAPFSADAGFSTVTVDGTNAADYPGVTPGTYILVDADTISSVTLDVGNVTEDETYVLDVYAISREVGTDTAGSGVEDDLTDNIEVVPTTVSITVNDGVPSIISATGTNIGLTEVGLDVADDVETATVTFDPGTDGIDSVTLGLATGFAVPVVVGVDEPLSWDQTVGGEWEARDADDNLLLTVSVSDTEVGGNVVATVTATLSDEFKHLASTDSLEITGFEVVADEGVVDGDTVAQAITITVTDDSPVAKSDVDSVAELSSTTGNVIAGVGSDGADIAGADSGITVIGAEKGVVGSQASLPASIAGDYGTLALGSDGTYTYTQTVVVSEDKSDVFTYTIEDADGDTSTTTLTINVVNNTDIPTLDVSNGSVDEAGLSTGSTPSATSEFTGPQDLGIDANGETFTISVGGVAVIGNGQVVIGTHGNLTINLDGTYSYELTSALNHDTTTPSDIFAISVVDATGDEVTGNITISITDDGPIAKSDIDSVAELGSTTGNVISGVGDADSALLADTEGADGGITVIGAAKGDVGDQSILPASITGDFGTLVLGSGGTYTYTQTVVVSEDKSDVFTYTIEDADGEISTTTLTINIVNNTDIPTLDVSNGSVDEAGLSTGSTPSATSEFTGPQDLGIDANGETFTISVGGVVVIGNGQVVIGTHGNLTINLDGTYSYELTSALNHDTTTPSDIFTISVVDATGDEVTGNITISITDDGPIAKSDIDSVAELGSTTGNVISGVGDADSALLADTEGADGGITVVGAAKGDVGDQSILPASITGDFGTLALGSDGTYTYTQTVAVSEDKSDVFTYTIEDVDGEISTTTLTINVVNNTDIPRLMSAMVLLMKPGFPQVARQVLRVSSLVHKTLVLMPMVRRSQSVLVELLLLEMARSL
ncbi:beta strand repeat-containing protein [Kiloniella sp.]|uniref:beta strand repeat-containing protein n=1 Tax=Kiloniella sp. TaxID=1938587 RepID=UPI003B026114